MAPHFENQSIKLNQQVLLNYIQHGAIFSAGIGQITLRVLL